MSNQQISLRQQLINIQQRFKPKRRTNITVPKETADNLIPTTPTNETIVTPTINTSTIYESPKQVPIIPSDINDKQIISTPVTNLSRPSFKQQINSRFTRYNPLTSYNQRQKSIPIQSQYISPVKKPTYDSSDFDKYQNALKKYENEVLSYEQENQKNINEYNIAMAKYNSDLAEYNKQLSIANEKNYFILPAEEKNQESSISSSNIISTGSSSIWKPEKKYLLMPDEEVGKEVFLNPETAKQVTDWNSKVEEYNKEKADYDAKLAEYNKQLDEYNKAKADYDFKLDEYNKEVEALDFAQKLYYGAKHGQNPYIFVQPQKVQKWFDKLERAEASIRYAAAHGNLTEKEYQKYFGVKKPTSADLASPTFSLTAPTVPEGFQGVSDPNVSGGVYFEKIPVAPTVVTNNLLTNVIKPPVNPITNVFNTTKPVEPTAIKVPVNTVSLGEVLKPPTNPFTDLFSSTKPNEPVKSISITPIAQNIMISPNSNLVGIAPSLSTQTKTFTPPMSTKTNMQPTLNLGFQEATKQTSELVPYKKVDQYKLPFFKSVERNLEQGYNTATQNQNFLLAGVTFAGGAAYGFGKGIITTPVTMAKLPYQFLTRPGEVIEGIVRTPESIKMGLEKNPGATTGEVASMILFPELVKKVPIKTVDFFRTVGKEKLPSEDIIAPEYTQKYNLIHGKYPAIAKGETAGQLLEEFKPLLPGETKPAGFTASPSSFSKVTEVKAGSSELPGLYQAPKLSPTFLRVTKGENPVFGLNPFETLRPTIARVTPTSYELVPGLNFESKVGTVSKNIVKDFFYKAAEKGKSYVPYLKTEKEAVLPYGTQLQQTASRYFIEFEGRKIPIKEFEALSGESISKAAKTVTAEDVTRITGRRIGGSPTFSPLDLARLKYGSSTSSSITSKSSAISINYNRPSVSNVKDITILPYSYDKLSSGKVLPVSNIYMSISKPKQTTVSILGSSPSRPKEPTYYVAPSTSKSSTVNIDKPYYSKPKPSQPNFYIPNEPFRNIPKNPNYNYDYKSKPSSVTTYKPKDYDYKEYKLKSPAPTKYSSSKKYKLPGSPLKDKEEYKISGKKKELPLTKGYDVLVRSKGKVGTIGKNLPYGKALQLGTKISKSSLLQTFALKESGYTKEQDVNFNVPTNVFSQPKLKKTMITPMTFTERRGKTLSERKEVKDIMSENKKKKKNKFNLF